MRGGAPPDHRWFVDTIEGGAAAACDSVDAEVWLAEFDCAFARIAGRFSRAEPRRRVRAFLLGLLSDMDRRSCWQLAYRAGNASPHGTQQCGEDRRLPRQGDPLLVVAEAGQGA